MKLIFLVALVYLAAEWPTPSVCWPMSQQYGSMDTSPLSSIIGQQMLSNQMNSYGMNTLMNGLGSRFNPDLMKAFVSNNGNTEQRTAFSRASNHAKSKKLSNTKFMLKPTETVEVEQPSEEAIEKFEQEFEIETPKAATTVAEKQTKTQELKTAAVKEQPAQQANVETKVEAAKVEETQQVKQKEEEVKQAVVEEVVQKAQQQVQETEQQTSNVEKQTPSESAAVNEHPAVKALQEASNIEEFQVPGHASYVEPFATQQQQSYGENVRMLNGRQSNRMHHQQHQQHNRMHQQQQEHQQAYDQFFTNEFIPQQKQQQAAAANVNKPMKFKMAKPDNVHNVGIDTITDEMSRVLSMRKDDQQKDQSDSNNKNNNNNNGGSYAQRNGYNPYNSQFPTYGRNFGGNAGYATNSPSYVPNIPSASTYMPNTDQLAQAFSSLIIIVNSNANSNLGVTLIDIDLFRSFLSQFASKSVDEVLKDGSLENKINDFNKERERTLSASTNGKNAEKGKKNESVSKLSANVPSYSNDPAQPIDSHSESTVLLNRKGGYNNGYASSNPYTYSYVPYQSGGLIVVNNVNDNYNKVVKSVLSGKGTNIGKNDAFVLPLPPNEITRLMEDAVIVNNDNKNTNIN